MNLSQIKLKNISLYFNNIVSQPRPLKYLFGVVLMLSGISKFIKINRGTYRLLFHPTALSLNYYCYNNERNDDELLLTKILKQDDVYVDIGANIGTLILKASTLVGEFGKVYGFEPHPKTYAFLNSNIELNNFKNVKIFNLALGNEKGVTWFSDLGSDDQNAVNLENEGIKVSLDLLDNVLHLEKISLLKIDVEGFELFVLKGAISALKITDNLIIEISEVAFNKFGYSVKDLILFIESYDFKCYKINQLNHFELIDNNYNSTKVENIICSKTFNINWFH